MSTINITHDHDIQAIFLQSDKNWAETIFAKNSQELKDFEVFLKNHKYDLNSRHGKLYNKVSEKINELKHEYSEAKQENLSEVKNVVKESKSIHVTERQDLANLILESGSNLFLDEIVKCESLTVNGAHSLNGIEFNSKIISEMPNSFLIFDRDAHQLKQVSLAGELSSLVNNVEPATQSA